MLDTLRSAAPARRDGAELRRASKRPSPAGRLAVRRSATTLADGRCESPPARVVNATGPWAAGLPQSRVRLRLTKGVHLVIDRQRLPVPDAVVMTEGARILFAIPWGERVILGTTDTDYAGPLEAVRAEPADVHYILGVVNDALSRRPDSAAADVMRTLGRTAAADRRSPRPARRTSRGAHEIRMPRARLARRGRRQADDLSPDRPTGGRSALARTWAARPRAAGRPRSRCCDAGEARRPAASFRRAVGPEAGPALLPARMGACTWTTSWSAARLALLSCRRGGDCPTSGRLDGRNPGLGRGPATGRTGAVRRDGQRGAGSGMSGPALPSRARAGYHGTHT